MDRKSLLQQVDDAFKANADAEQFHVTSDGMCFRQASVARNHCKMLGPHGTVEVMSRENVARELSGKGKAKEDFETGIKRVVEEALVKAVQGGELVLANDNGGEESGDNASGDTETTAPAATSTAQKAAPKKAAPKKAAKKTTKKK